ncbi:hypothetical protein C8Q79DRAFT_974236 [Trametes meyenii]|nr:hypothetical protein C8Q79DRAFT_974236 [Trametes meyenii]
MNAARYTVVPAGVLDSSHATDSVIVTGWVLDQRVDPQKFREAWTKLITAWPILVGRLRRGQRPTRRWEYHVPVEPSIDGSFATLNIAGPIRDHYKYAEPTDSIRVTFKENPHHLFFPEAPRDVASLLKRDAPMVHLHITNFDDGSLIGLYTPHILCDGHGVANIVRALTTILAGGPPPAPLDHTDPFLPYNANEAKVPAPYGWRALSLIETIWVYARAFWEWAFDNNVENRDVYFPPSEVKRIKAEAMRDIREEYGEKTELYVSSSDAILAYCLKLKHPPTSSSAPLNVFYTANLRKLITLPEPFLHNSVCMVITPTLPVSALSKMTLGALALHIRRTLETQTTPGAIETWVRWRLQNAHRKKLFFDPWRGEWDVVTNWREMKLVNTDFSAGLFDEPKAKAVENGDGAVVAANGNGAAKRSVRCLYMWGNGIQPIPLRNWIGIWADDPSGGMWTSGFFPKRIWEDKRGFGAYIQK